MSFQQGLSGLNAASKGLDAVSNNVANSSTVGFKASQAHFADIYAASLSGGGAGGAGIGTSVAAIQQQFTQGNITTTNNTLDLAINGGGFYKTTSSDGTIVYTRNGQFHSDKQGYIINDQNYRLMGYAATSSGAIVKSDPGAIKLDTSNLAPQPTGAALGGNAKAVLNLDSRTVAPTSTTFNTSDPASYTYSTAMTVYDTLGVDHTLTLYFGKSTPQPATGSTWDVHAALDGTVSTAWNPLKLTFDSSGNLTAQSTKADPMTPPDLPGDWVVTTGASTPLGTWDDPAVAGTGNPLPNWMLDFKGTTSYGGTSTANSTYQGGYAQGTLTGYSVAKDGVVKGNYSNGQTKILAQVVLTTFPDPNGLMNLGNNQWQETSTSGQGVDGVPGSGARGPIQSSAVEDSNVDLTAELVNMITLQRNYQANSQSIKTQDAIMQTLVSLR
jgi:flagellar hook protein FlgE